MNMILITNSLYHYDTQSMLFGLAKPCSKLINREAPLGGESDIGKKLFHCHLLMVHLHSVSFAKYTTHVGSLL